MKLGFFDPSDFQKMLENIDIKNEFEGNQGAQIVHLLSPIFNQASMDEDF